MAGSLRFCSRIEFLALDAQPALLDGLFSFVSTGFLVSQMCGSQLPIQCRLTYGALPASAIHLHASDHKQAREGADESRSFVDLCGMPMAGNAGVGT